MRGGLECARTLDGACSLACLGHPLSKAPPTHWPNGYVSKRTKGSAGLLARVSNRAKACVLLGSLGGLFGGRAAFLLKVMEKIITYLVLLPPTHPFEIKSGFDD